MKRGTGTAERYGGRQEPGYRSADQDDGHSPRMRIEEEGHCLVVSVGGAHSNAARAVARAMPAEEDRITVIMPQLSESMIPELLERLRSWVPIRWESIRLVAAGAMQRGAGRAADTAATGGPGVPG